MSTDSKKEQSPLPTDDDVHVYLLPWQYDSIYGEPGQAKFLYIVGARGAGKSKTDEPRVIHWSSELSSDLPFGIFANTDAQLHTVLAPIESAVEELGYRTCYETEAPAEWRAAWRRQGLIVPHRRLRNMKFWIWQDGTHIATGSLLNYSYTRFKGIDMNAILIQEGTEPGVTEDAINTLAGNLRCGKAQKVNGVWRCMEPGHLHQMVFIANVPLNDPSHWIYKKVEGLKKLEAKRRLAGLPTFFVLMSPRTKDNPFTGAGYDDILRAAFDEATYLQQTSGSLERNVAALTYHAFSEQNVLDSLVYDPKRPLHMWFDNNAVPAAVGWGHDLRWNEVPEQERREGHEYFGVIGELFSDNDPMQAEQVARALLEDPYVNGRCVDCEHPMERHMKGLFVCYVCGSEPAGGRCSGRVYEYEHSALQYLHLPPPGHGHPWRGLANHIGRIYIYGDASMSASHSDASKRGGYLQILRDVFTPALEGRVHFRFKKANPPVRWREIAVNRGLRDAAQVRSDFFAPWCTAHIDDFNEIVPDPKTGVAKKEARPKHPSPSNTYWKRTHMTDAWGYHKDWRWPFEAGKSDRMPSQTDPDDLEWKIQRMVAEERQR